MRSLAELERARELYAQRAWRNAHAALSAVDGQEPLGAADLERLATAAYMVGHLEEYFEVLGPGTPRPLGRGRRIACEAAYELGRVQEWTAALAAWCDEQPDMVAFTGRCSVHRSGIMGLRGAWAEALAEAQRAGRRCMVADADWFRGLPDDRCPVPRWGYVLAGMITFRFPSGEETCVAGDAYYVPPGHTPVHFAGAEIVEFSPTEPLQETIGVVMGNATEAA